MDASPHQQVTDPGGTTLLPPTASNAVPLSSYEKQRAILNANTTTLLELKFLQKYYRDRHPAITTPSGYNGTQLLGQPPEMRNRIWILVVKTHQTVHIQGRVGCPREQPLIPGLLATNKQVRKEALGLYYKNNAFVVRIAKSRHRDLLKSGIKFFQRIIDRYSTNALSEVHFRFVDTISLVYLVKIVRLMYKSGIIFHVQFPEPKTDNHDQVQTVSPQFTVHVPRNKSYRDTMNSMFELGQTAKALGYSLAQTEDRARHIAFGYGLYYPSAKLLRLEAGENDPKSDNESENESDWESSPQVQHQLMNSYGAVNHKRHLQQSSGPPSPKALPKPIRKAPAPIITHPPQRQAQPMFSNNAMRHPQQLSGPPPPKVLTKPVRKAPAPIIVNPPQPVPCYGTMRHPQQSFGLPTPPVSGKSPAVSDLEVCTIKGCVVCKRSPPPSPDATTRTIASTISDHLMPYLEESTSPGRSPSYGRVLSENELIASSPRELVEFFAYVYDPNPYAVTPTWLQQRRSMAMTAPSPAPSVFYPSKTALVRTDNSFRAPNIRDGDQLAPLYADNSPDAPDSNVPAQGHSIAKTASSATPSPVYPRNSAWMLRRAQGLSMDTTVPHPSHPHQAPSPVITPCSYRTATAGPVGALQNLDLPSSVMAGSSLIDVNDESSQFGEDDDVHDWDSEEFSVGLALSN